MLEVTYHFCPILSIVQTYPGTRWKKVTQGYECQEVGNSRGILEAGYHTPSAHFCSSSTILPENPSLFMVKEGTLGILRM